MKEKVIFSDEYFEYWRDGLDYMTTQLVKNPTTVHLGYLFTEMYKYMYSYTSYVSGKGMEKVFSSTEAEKKFISFFKETVEYLMSSRYEIKYVLKLLNAFIGNTEVVRKFVSFGFKKDSTLYRVFLEEGSLLRIRRDIFERGETRKILKALVQGLLKKHNVFEVLDILDKKGYNLNMCREIVCECLESSYLVD